jgi:peptide deformylase
MCLGSSETRFLRGLVLVGLPDPRNCQLVLYPHPVLRTKCAEVEEFTPKLSAFVVRMFELMREAKGVGLAAPQVGVAVRLFVCNPSGEPEDDRVFINPRIVGSEGSTEFDEGCLSLPGVTVNMRRAQRLVVEAKDVAGRGVRIEAEEMLARIVQHESDHLDGRLIIDRMSEADEIANRRVVKQLEESYASQSR